MNLDAGRFLDSKTVERGEPEVKEGGERALSYKADTEVALHAGRRSAAEQPGRTLPKLALPSATAAPRRTSPPLMMAAQRPPVAGGVRAVVVVPGPNYGAQGHWCRRAEVLVALQKSESSNR